MLESLRIDCVGFGMEISHLGEWEGCRPCALLQVKRDVPPRGSRKRHLLGMGQDNLFTDPGGAPDVGSQPDGPIGWQWTASCTPQSECKKIADVAD
jgi:hypothetical protein